VVKARASTTTFRPMGTPALAAVLVVVGIVAALVGLVFSVLMSQRRPAAGPSPALHTDPGLVVVVSGLVVAIFGAGDWVFMVLTT
jgi:hypothetical protein